MTELNDILNGDGKGKIPEDKLMAYLEGKLSAQEQREIEKFLNEEGMEADAIEGLQELTAGEANNMTSAINHRLNAELKKGKKTRKTAINNYWGVIAIIVILLLCIAGYLVLVLAAKQ